MTPERIAALRELYGRALLEDVIPFWMRNAPDREHGGFLHHLDREGKVFSTDKGVWIQGRAVWMLSTLCLELETREDWLDAARSGYDFLTRHAFDSDGRMFFLLTRDGRPLRKRRYLFSEAFGAIACAAYGRLSGSDEAKQRAMDIFRLMVQYHRTPGLLEAKIDPWVRPMKSHAMPMILLATVQQLRALGPDPLLEDVARDCVRELLADFLRPDIPALVENVGPRGERLEGPAGRLVNPGHAIESAWFLLREAQRTGDTALRDTACDIIGWSITLGWDREDGGLFSFVDVEGRPCEQLEWDMKLWWPHTEALYALLLAHHLTGRRDFLDWFERIHEYTFAHFPDPVNGEWFGYLHRDGSVANTLKGSLWKGPFHIPRALLFSLQLLDEMKGRIL